MNTLILEYSIRSTLDTISHILKQSDLYTTQMTNQFHLLKKLLAQHYLMIVDNLV